MINPPAGIGRALTCCSCDRDASGALEASDPPGAEYPGSAHFGSTYKQPFRGVASVSANHTVKKRGLPSSSPAMYAVVAAFGGDVAVSMRWPASRRGLLISPLPTAAAHVPRVEVPYGNEWLAAHHLRQGVGQLLVHPPRLVKYDHVARPPPALPQEDDSLGQQRGERPGCTRDDVYGGVPVVAEAALASSANGSTSEKRTDVAGSIVLPTCLVEYRVSEREREYGR
eukprot:CAMPEP_0119467258 /NCGR_PEP_ID=MMETSP1344-20130328/1531_1 /TAXON_ID=236787 /ORGANISM="Florenciella parvula, Strain CCMP2471" /LENGTH=226 /DNA_ID=CAMNT_0007499615 /DNA_START=22 /DNA_END=699 /DNA_ORIENTATION=+